MGKPKKSEKYLTHFHLVHHKSHIKLTRARTRTSAVRYWCLPPEPHTYVKKTLQT
jgi:hypothetical protein